MIKFTLWLIRVLRRLNKQDRASLRAAITRWVDWKQNKDAEVLDVKPLHDNFVTHYLPMGAGYVLLVSQSHTKSNGSVNVEITFSSNLSNDQVLEMFKAVNRSLGNKEHLCLLDAFKNEIGKPAITEVP